MKDKKKSKPIKPRGMSLEEKHRLISDMIRDAIAELTKARLILAEGGWEETTDMLTAMTLTNFGKLNANYARQWIWELATERGATREDLHHVRAAPELRDARPVDPTTRAKRMKSQKAEPDTP